jgi:hypothetical protein
MRRYRRQTSRLLVAGTAWVLVGALLAPVVLAGVAYSSFSFYSSYGVSYKNRSVVQTDPPNNHQALARTDVYVTAGSALAGWIGVLPRRYSDSGVLQCTGTWSYSGSTITVGGGYIAPGCFVYAAGSYTSDGQTKAWNGNSYTTFGAATSPAQTS